MRSALANHKVCVKEEALNGKIFYEMLKSNSLNSGIVLLDIEMPEMDGGKTLDLIKKEYPNIKVIMLSQYIDEELIRDLFNRGANAYLTKDMEAVEIADAINQVNLNGEYRGNLLQLFKKNQSITKRNFLKTLYTNRETSIIVRLCEGKSVSEIASELYVINKTIESHLTDIYRKSGTKNKSEFLIYAIKEGLNYLGRKAFKHAQAEIKKTK